MYCACTVRCLCAECSSTGQRHTVVNSAATARWCHAQVCSDVLTPCWSATSRRTYSLWCTWLCTARSTANENPQATTVGVLWCMRSLAAFRLCRHHKETTWCLRMLNLSGTVRLVMWCSYFMLSFVYNHPGKLSLAIPSWVHTMSTGQRAVMLCDWEVKADMVLFAGNTVWSISERVRGVRVDAL